MAIASKLVAYLICAAISTVAIPLGAATTATRENSSHEIVQLPVRVVDPDGEPVAGAVVIPWALRCSQGHGLWCEKGFGRSQPPTLKTDAEGDTLVPYPRYAIADERVLTTEVTLSVDHPNFSYVNYEYVNVPTTDQSPHKIKLQRGAVVEIVPLANGSPVPLEGIYAVWSDDRSWKPNVKLTHTDDGALQIPRMPAGKQQLLLVKLQGEHATHFSPILDFDLKDNDTVRQRIELRPAVHIEGALSDNVPRPVKNGRVSARNLPRESDGEHVRWFAWAPVGADGTFAIRSWPAGESAQIIALCDGFIGESGKAPDIIQNLRVPDSFQRPQVFLPEAQSQPIVLRMTPLVRCNIEAVDQNDSPVAGAKVGSCPNVGWWNIGSQVYCTPLARSERVLVKRDFMACVDNAFPRPFETTTDANGRGTLELPFIRAHEDLYADHNDFELPVVRGRREQRVVLTAGATTNARLVLQSKGAEHLGDWDKLAGVLFGCTGEQCRRLLNDPGFRSDMDVVREMLDSAKDPTDPAVLTAAYLTTADAFDKLDDKEEAAKWRLKAAKQAAKLMPTDNPPVSADGSHYR